MSDIEQSILRQIANINQQIRDLQGEQRTLERLLLRVRRGDETQREVTRKNSVTKILIENTILAALRSASKPMGARDLYAAVRNVAPDLKNSTFRSHLKRMKDRGDIQRLLGHGSSWLLPDG